MPRNSEVVSPQRAERAEKSALAQHETEWLTAKEAAAHLRVKARTLLLWTRQGRVNGKLFPATSVAFGVVCARNWAQLCSGKPVLCSVRHGANCSGRERLLGSEP